MYSGESVCIRESHSKRHSEESFAQAGILWSHVVSETNVRLTQRDAPPFQTARVRARGVRGARGVLDWGAGRPCANISWSWSYELDC